MFDNVLALLWSQLFQVTTTKSEKRLFDLCHRDDIFICQISILPQLIVCQSLLSALKVQN